MHPFIGTNLFRMQYVFGKFVAVSIAPLRMQQICGPRKQKNKWGKEIIII